MMKPIISLSTSYNQHKFMTDGYALLCDAAEMGYEYAELGHSTPVTCVEGIAKAVAEGVIKISSTHNFCPLPAYRSGAAPNLFSPSSGSKAESELWLRHTKNSLIFAKEFGAKALVCHSGSLSYFFMRPDCKISKFVKDKKREDLAENPKYKKIAEAFMKSSAERALKRDYPRLKQNILAISETAEECGVIIGIENREGISELPLDWNFDAAMAQLSDIPQARAWHDVGHSMRKQLLGLGGQLDLVRRTENLIAGWHLHDCTAEGKDHVGIGKGCIDFGALSKFFKPEQHIFTLELNRAVPREDAVESLKRVRDMMP